MKMSVINSVVDRHLLKTVFFDQGHKSRMIKGRKVTPFLPIPRRM